MAKRSRSPEPEELGESSSTARSVIHPSTVETASKVQHLDSESGEVLVAMRCSLPPHRQALTFATYEEYDVHYAKTHTNRCLECRKNFPTEHFLNLHIEENHDSLFRVRQERGEKMYSCFVEDCERKCSTPPKRKRHLIDKHSFPRDYDFYVVNDGIDRRSSMLKSGRHRRRSSAQRHLTEINRRRSSTMETVDSEEDGDNSMEEEQGMKPPDTREVDAEGTTPPSSTGDVDMEVLSGAMSALKFVPTSIRFGRGRGRGRGGFSRT